MGELLSAHGSRVLSRFTVGLTGGLGCGKSAVAAVLSELGAAVLGTDAVTHRLYEPGGEGSRALSKMLGTEVLGVHGGVDRPRLAAKLFADPALRRQVEGAIHPLVRAEVSRWLATLPPEALPVVEIPLLFESGLEGHYGSVVVVSCSQENQRERLRARHPDWTEDDLRNRLSAQMPLAEKVRRAHHVVSNDAGMPDLRAGCARLYEELLAEKAPWEKDA